jgi:hypothetical protein
MGGKLPDASFSNPEPLVSPSTVAPEPAEIYADPTDFDPVDPIDIF